MLSLCFKYMLAFEREEERERQQHVSLVAFMLLLLPLPAPSRRRVIISTAFRVADANPLHAKVPFDGGHDHPAPRGRWMNFAIDLHRLIAVCRFYESRLEAGTGQIVFVIRFAQVSAAARIPQLPIILSIFSVLALFYFLLFCAQLSLFIFPLIRFLLLLLFQSRCTSRPPSSVAWITF